MKYHNVSAILLLSLVASTGAMAAPNITVSGTIPADVQINQKIDSHARTLTSKPSVKKISLMRIELSPKAERYLANEASNQNMTKTLFSTAYNTSLPLSGTVGMNGVPVLDQGQHGSCATFADTGAIDAAYGKTDYISQLCNLELGSYLEEEAKKAGYDYPSGWKGSLNEIVLGQINKYGIVNMDTQKREGCGTKQKVYVYPLNNEKDEGVPITETDFRKISAPTISFHSKMLLSAEDAFSRRANTEKVLNNIKQAITRGNRVVIGFLIDVNDDLKYVNGATGAYRDVANDSWVLTPKIVGDAKIPKKIRAGHAVIIVGYDDTAEIIGSDAKRTRHKGVLTIRNSWSEEAGDKGEYYMSYDYFKLLGMETIEIGANPIN